MEIYLYPERSDGAESKTHMSSGHAQFNSIKSRHTPHPKARQNPKRRHFDYLEC